VNERGLIALLKPERLRRILSKMLDENEFLGPYGLRALSKFHEGNPYVFHVNGQEYRVDYLPAESDSGMFGGNSNWRGPVWMPVNVMIIRALLNFYLYYGDNFKIDEPLRGLQGTCGPADQDLSSRWRATPCLWLD
jgi:glycogen debranching enzyme